MASPRELPSGPNTCAAPSDRAPPSPRASSDAAPAAPLGEHLRAAAEVADANADATATAISLEPIQPRVPAQPEHPASPPAETDAGASPRRTDATVGELRVDINDVPAPPRSGRQPPRAPKGDSSGSTSFSSRVCSVLSVLLGILNTLMTLYLLGGGLSITLYYTHDRNLRPFEAWTSVFLGGFIVFLYVQALVLRHKAWKSKLLRLARQTPIATMLRYTLVGGLVGLLGIVWALIPCFYRAANGKGFNVTNTSDRFIVAWNCINSLMVLSSHVWTTYSFVQRNLQLAGEVKRWKSKLRYPYSSEHQALGAAGAFRWVRVSKCVSAETPSLPRSVHKLDRFLFGLRKQLASRWTLFELSGHIVLSILITGGFIAKTIVGIHDKFVNDPLWCQLLVATALINIFTLTVFFSAARLASKIQSLKHRYLLTTVLQYAGRTHNLHYVRASFWASEYIGYKVLGAELTWSRLFAAATLPVGAIVTTLIKSLVP